MKQTPKKTDPLTLGEMTAAADIFFPLFNVVNERMPDTSKTEDVLKVMESVAKLGHKLREEKRADERKERFGFNKNNKDAED